MNLPVNEGIQLHRDLMTATVLLGASRSGALLYAHSTVVVDSQHPHTVRVDLDTSVRSTTESESQRKRM